MGGYAEFLQSKRIVSSASGFDVAEGDLNPMLYPFQKAVTRWALRRGKAAIFADCGLGKTPIQLEWAHRVAQHTGSKVLIVAPLAVSAQTVAEGAKFGIGCRVAVDRSGLAPEISVTNYEKLHHFDPADFGGIVLDESSILKSYEGHYRQRLTEFASGIDFRLCCTATPAPNDTTELINHSEFLDILTGKEILALFFKQDGNTTHKWKIKGHGETDFWRWLASWSVAFRSPDDLGFDGADFVLPELRHFEHVVKANGDAHGTLFAVEARTLSERRAARRASMPERVALAAGLVAAAPDEQWILWCDLNAESEALRKAIPGAVEVRGSDSPEHKAGAMLGFSEGTVRYMVTKPSIAGFGMNWQNCARMAFVGLSDSYEQMYQATRRCWRFGQERPVEVHIVIGEEEGAVRANIERKERQAADMFDNLVEHLQLYQLGAAERQEMAVEYEESEGDDWRMMLGDSFHLLDSLEESSVGLSVFSPPFPGMYAYTNTPADVGNCGSIGELVDHFGQLAPKILHALKPGRHCCVHLTQVPAFKWVDGYIGMKDFRGAVIAMMESAGFIYYGEVCIDKDPQIKAIRTKDRGLLFKTLATDASHLHPALADYLLQFRKPGDPTEPIRAGISRKYGNPDGWVTPEEWIEWAHPVWYAARQGIPGGISETDVLNVRAAREEKDERHLCPLQLGVIERAVLLWSNPGDLVLSPFAGIGSEGVGALKHDRRFLGMELKRSYYESACKFLKEASTTGRRQPRLELKAADGSTA